VIERVEALRADALERIAGAETADALQQLRSVLLGKKGDLSQLMRGLKNASMEERKTLGQATNRVKAEIQTALKDREITLLDAESNLPDGFDVTLPGTAPSGGALHPITQMMYDLNDAFASLGFEIYEGPEISSELFAFDSLNFPPDHPARESMDTYWLAGHDQGQGAKRLCLRPHLTGGSVRYMQTHEPPFRFVYPGRVFRNETTDASHERAFFQYEALIVDEAVPFTAGRLLINTILSTVFGREVKTRMRAGFFPFVEPGFEIDMECLVCQGDGCSVCKQVGWLEVMPGGPPHPEVLTSGGIDPSKWEGFYINIGLDRLVMMRYGVDDVRQFHSADLRFLQQFR
jgi:phenylalanyl-tRNA synthetase alpha chain